MKKPFAVILALSLVAIGCGSTPTQTPPGGTLAQPSAPAASGVPNVTTSAQPTPALPVYKTAPSANAAAAVNAALDALVAKKWSALPGLICADKRASLARMYDPAAETMYPREATRTLVNALTIGVANRSVTVTSHTPTSAVVKVGGTLTQEISDQALKDFGSALAAAAKVTPDQAMLDGISTTLKASMDSIVLSPTAQVVVEDGGWLLCSDPLMTPGDQPTSGSPATPEPTPTSAIVPTPAADPVAAVNALLDALVAKQFDKLPALMCADLRSSASISTGQSTDPQVTQLLDTMTIDIANRNVTLKGKMAMGVPWRVVSNGTLVDIAGQLSVGIPDAAIQALLDKTNAASSSPSPDPSAMAQGIKGVHDLLTAVSIAPVVRVANEGDGWLVCSNVIIVADLASASPAP